MKTKFLLPLIMGLALVCSGQINNGGGGSGTVSNSGTLTSNAVIVGNGTTAVKADTGCSTDGAGALTCVSFTTSGSGAAFTDYVTAAFADSASGHCRAGSFTGDLFEISCGGAAKVAAATLQGDLGGTFASPQVISAHFTGDVAYGTTYSTITVANDGTTGTTANLLVEINASGNAIKPLTTDTARPQVGVCVTTGGGVCSTSGSAHIAFAGIVACVADNTVTTGDIIGVGTTTAGRCKSLGAAASIPGSALAVVGVAQSGAAAGSNFNLILAPNQNQGYALNNITAPTASVTFASGNTVNFQTNQATVTPLKVSSSTTPTTANVFNVTDSGNTCQFCVDARYHATDPGNLAILTSDFTDSSSASLQNITGLSFTLPQSAAQNINLECNLMWSQATNVSDQLGIQFNTNAPTRFDGYLTTTLAGPSATSAPLAYGAITNLTATTATAFQTFTPTATTVQHAEIHGVAQMPSSAGTGTLQMMVQQSTAADVIKILAGSYCKIW